MESSSNIQFQTMNRTQSLEQVLGCSINNQQQQQQPEKRLRPPQQQEQSLRCPRCDSPNTKFCYYNNYSLSQPRYFCKGCRRYWTQGGSLRNVPVGGGCRKNKRSSSSSSKASTKSNSLLATTLSTPPIKYDTFLSGNPNFNPPIPSATTTATTPVLLDILRGSGFLDTSTSHGGSQNLCYGNLDELEWGGGGGGGGVLLPFGGVGGATATVEQDGNLMMGLQWQEVDSTGDGNIVPDSAGRDCSWVVGGSSWHGLVNSSMM